MLDSHRLVRSDAAARSFGIPVRMAREMVMEQTRRQLLHGRSAWAVSISGFMFSGWLLFETTHSPAVHVLVGTGCLWMLIGCRQADEAVRAEASLRAARMHGIVHGQSSFAELSRDATAAESGR